MIEFNLNYRMGVKLTELGIEILRQRHEEFRRRVPSVPEFELKLDEDGYYRDQAWSIMQVFGEHVGMARPPVFSTEVRLYPPAPAVPTFTETPDLAMFGWAPGGYSFRCVDCPPDTDWDAMWGAKRAWRCEKHAQEKLDAWHGRNAESAPAAGAPKTTVDG